ncbi:MAG: AbrB family transcriptional regulator [Hyphomicrobiaceae bacterium]
MRFAGNGLLARSQPVQWAVMLGLSAVLSLIAMQCALPAAFMVGPMCAAIALAVAGASIRMPATSFIVAQGVVGCMIGQSVPLDMFDDLALHWPLFGLGIGGVILAASGIGYALTHRGMLPGTTAIWGTSPGASTAMIVMSEEYGADPRLVAVMQYLRVFCVVAVAALVARFWSPGEDVRVATVQVATVWFPPLTWGFVATLGLAGGCSLLGTWLRVPAGALLLPFAGTIALQQTGWLAIQLPPWMLALAYALVGWSIGLRFTRPILAHAFWELPRILLAIVSLMVLCGLMAVVLVLVGGIDPLTAYLATSPGGADSIAIIAMAAPFPVDVRFVLAMQMSRLMVAMLVCPILSRAIAKRAIGSGADSHIKDRS